MPWEERTPMAERKRFIEDVEQGEESVAALCRRYGVSRKTGYKWLKRYREEGESGLQDRSRRPHRSPRRTRAAVETRLVDGRRQHPAWGPRKLRASLNDDTLPALSTINRVLQRHGQIDPLASLQHRPLQRFEHPTPNALWQMDFKGDWRLPDGSRCYPVTVLDDHSRFLLTLTACANQTAATVQQALKTAFRCYGLPDRMRMDNGTPWSEGAQTPYTQLTVWLLQLDISLSHGRPFHPQTQGKDERLHRTLNQELLAFQHADTLLEWQQHFDGWRDLYYHQRPHQALADRPPDSRYQPSARPFPETLPAPDYPSCMQVRRVDVNGCISFRNQYLRIGKAFTHFPVGILLDATPGDQIQVYFGRFCVQSFDRSTLQKLLPVSQNDLLPISPVNTSTREKGPGDEGFRQCEGRGTTAPLAP